MTPIEAARIFRAMGETEIRDGGALCGHAEYVDYQPQPDRPWKACLDGNFTAEEASK